MQLSPVIQRRLLWLGAAIAVAAYFPRFRHGSGSEVFSAAADCMLHGQTPRHCGDLIYAYPPFFALLWTPLAPLPQLGREIVWYLVILGTIFAALKLSEALVRRTFAGDWSERELVTFRAVTFVLGLKLMLSVLSNQAYDSLGATFIFAGLLALISGRSLLGGASLAVAAALKLTPVIFLPYLLFKGRFAAAGVFTVVLVFLALLPDVLLPSPGQWHIVVWIRDIVLAPMTVKPGFDLPFWITDTPLNQSFYTAMVRLFTGVHEQQPFDVVFAITQSTAFKIALNSVMGVYIIIVGCVMLKSRRHDGLIAVDGALLVISAILLSPVSSQSHFIGLLLPYALIAAAAVRDPSKRVFHSAMLIATFVLTTATSNDLVGRSFSGWAVWNSFPMYGALVLVIPLAVLIWWPGAARKPGQEAVAR